MKIKRNLIKICLRWAVLLTAFGVAMLGVSRVEAVNYTYSPMVDLSTGSFSLFTNNGVVSEFFSVSMPAQQLFSLNNGDTISGVILFTNNQSMVVTNTTGTNSDSADFIFEPMPQSNVNSSSSIQLLGVSGQLGSPNPSFGGGNALAINQVTTSSASFRGIAYTFINDGNSVRVFPLDLQLQGGVGDISVGTSSAPILNLNVIHTFTNSPDGASPVGELILSGNTLYGTAEEGGSFGEGTVFAVNTNGMSFTNLYTFTATSGSNLTNTDGTDPNGLVLSNNTLYGTAGEGGSFGEGTVFKVNTDGTDFTNLHSFTALVSSTNGDGAFPQAVILSSNTLYGTAQEGGSSGEGAVFKVNTDGTGFTNLYSFTGGSYGSGPNAGLILSSNTLYGTAEGGGSSGDGTVFAINTDGTGFTNLYSFTGGSDGSHPNGGLILSGNTLYGTTLTGGFMGRGTVFAVNTDSTGFTNLYSFSAANAPDFNNSDGASPHYGLDLSGNTLYGTTFTGGSGNGTLFAINTDGTGFTNLYSFTVSTPFPNQINSDGVRPAVLLSSGNTLYGTATAGGNSGDGTVFNFSLGSVGAPPDYNQISGQLLSGGNMQLSFVGNVGTNYALDRTFNLAPPNWVPQATNPAGAGGVLVFTNTPNPATDNFWRIRSVP